MNRFGLSLVLLAAAGTAFAQPAIPFADAGLHAIQFIDKDEGWAAGDEGAIWHSIDGGKTWERQKSGTRASLRSIHFQTPYSGWVVGRLDTPNSGPSVGVMLKTADGGLTWEEVGTNVLPGLHVVRFIDEKNGFVCGDGSDSFPGGMFSTADGGRVWKPVAASRVPGWRAADFNSTGLHGILAGAWGKLGTLTVNGFKEAELDPLSGRTVHGVKLGKTSFAVGDGGLVLASADQGAKWGFANLGLSPAALANCDFKCVEAKGSHVWVAGRPGSVVLHSADDGKTWQVQKTNLGCPANAIHFLDENTGWLVGELGTISATTDGGKTWKLQTGGGQRSALLFLHAHGRSVPFETMTSLGLGEGYLAAAVGFMCADANTALPHRANDASRLRQAVRLAGGATAESVWSFPLPGHTEGLSPRELLATWDKAHGGKANEHLLRQTVLAIRTWQPEVIVTDVAAASASPAETLVLFAAKEAFKQAADPNAFPEQIAELGLKPWDAKKLYALCLEAPNAAVKFDASEFDTKLAGSAKDLAEPAVRLVADESASVPRRCFTLLAHRMHDAEKHVNLMDGVNLAPGGAARRTANANPLRPELAEILKKSIEARKHLEGLAANSDAELGGVDKAIAALGAEMKRLPGDIAAQTAYAVGSQFRRAGKWAEAREVYALLAEQYPGHPMALEAYRWLLRYHAGTEPRRRQEITQKLAFGRVSFDPLNGKLVVPAGGSNAPAATMNATEDIYRIYDAGMIQKWHQACLDYEPRLAAFGPVYSRDPSAWLNFLAARRQIGKHAEAEQFIREYFKRSPAAVSQKPGEDPWRDCLAAEIWLSDKTTIAVPPKPVGTCRFTETRPLLDGKLDDECWKDIKVMEVKGPRREGEAPAEPYRTDARFAYDSRFLYVAVTCSHPIGQAVPPVAKRDRDADLRGRDRVDITLDLDRDYQTYYRFQIDHRGCLAEDCWGDRSWNPKYFVAFNPGETGWTVEMAIPLVELTGEAVSGGKTWAANVTRVLPGNGVQAWSLPADAEPRPEGMGLLQFRAER